jgi:hypothetical protein
MWQNPNGEPYCQRWQQQMKRMRKRQETNSEPVFFPAGVDNKKYGRLKTELNTAYVAGHNNYPTTVESAVTMLPHYMNNNGLHMTDEDIGQATATSMQTSVPMGTAMMSHQLDQV